jgi:hypothetical protein
MIESIIIKVEIMEHIFIKLASICMGLFFISSSFGQSSSNIIYSKVAVSQGGRFAINYDFPLALDKLNSLKRTEFLSFQTSSGKNQIDIGAIITDEPLEFICQHPAFLSAENIAHPDGIRANEIKYFNTGKYKGCIIPIAEYGSALIVKRPELFVDQRGNKISYIGIVGNSRDISLLKKNILFDVSAKDFYINLLQVGQAFSPFSLKVDWKKISHEGLIFIGNETRTCRGLAAAARFLTPALNQQDLHSFVSLKGLGDAVCPLAPLPDDKNMQKWFAVPESTRTRIIDYTSNFHGYPLSKQIAYIYLPAIEDAFEQNTIDDKINVGRKAIALADDHACGAIVDLRFNTGGSLVPMLLTASSLLQTNNLFSLGEQQMVSLSHNGNQLVINPGNMLYGQYTGSISAQKRDIPVAILTNWMTGSSGAISSLALRDSSAGAKVFGTSTSSTTSVNETFYLLDGNTFNLMVDRIYNNKNILVPLSLPADEIIEDNLQTIFKLDEDNSLIVAKKWLLSQQSCSVR